MEYKITTKSLLSSLSSVLLFFFCTVVLIFLGDTKFAIAVVVLFLIFVIPQLFLIIPYSNVTTYKSFKIDYTDQLFIIEFEGKNIEKSFAELVSIQYHAAQIPVIYLSPVFKLCEHLYYYRFEFPDGTVYYLTSLVDPKPNFDPKGVFYAWYIDMERRYATIK